MAINVDEAAGFEEFGWKATDNDGNVLFYLTFGTGTPVGTQAPVPTIYIDENASIWKKIGALATEWEQIVNGDSNVDGGFANSVYTPDQCFDGGDA